MNSGDLNFRLCPDEVAVPVAGTPPRCPVASDPLSATVTTCALTVAPPPGNKATPPNTSTPDSIPATGLKGRSSSPSRRMAGLVAEPDSPSLDPDPASQDSHSPDLECLVCFSPFDNVFRCPKMLGCGHTFCLECLARINVQSVRPSALQCPLCRALTPLPALGPPKLTTDTAVLAVLPATMHKVYSVRFNRSKGKLRVKRLSAGQRSLRSVSHSLDVGLPGPATGGSGPGEEAGLGGLLVRLTERPACRAALLATVVTLMMLLSGIVIFLLTYKQD